MAYRLNDKTVIRAGYALTYVHAGGVGGRTNSRQGLSQLGFNGTNSQVSPSSGVPAYYWDNGVPAFAQPPPFLNAGYGAGFITGNPTGAQTVTYGDPDLGGKPPYYQNWNLGIQRSITANTTLGVAYSASVGHFLPGAGPGGYPTNIAPLQYLALGSLLTATATPTTLAQAQAIFPGIGLPFPNFVGTVGQLLRPFPQYGTISDPWANLANSSYHALQATINRRFSYGLTFSFGYTFSKELDDIATPRNPFNDSLEKSLGAIDHPHVATATFVYAVPFGAGRRFDPGNTVARAVLSHWMISGIYTYSTGSPLAPTATGCTSGGILGTCIPSYNPAFSGNIRINGDYGEGSVLGSTPTPYLNRAAFVDPAPYTVGNLPRTGVYGLFAPHNMDVDISLRREFAIRETVKLAIQCDSFNVNNAVHFGAPGTNPDQASFGTVTTQANQPRKLQLNARITF